MPRPIVSAITDRARLADPSPAGLIAQVQRAAAAGVQLIQIRERDLDGRALFDLVRLAVAAVRGTTARVLVNDRLDVALAAGAHGVHLRGMSFPAWRVRGIVPAGFLIGQSVHSVSEATAVRGADYLQFGTVFETASKPGVPSAGLHALAEVVQAVALPVLAVGGITAGRVADVINAGAAGFAAITMFAD